MQKRMNEVIFMDKPLTCPTGILSHKGRGERHKGFTLIELLVVVLIIGILAAVAVPQYQVAVAKSRYATLKNLVQSIKNAQEIYYLSHNGYTTKFNDLDIELPGGGEANEDNNKIVYKWGYCSLHEKTIYCINSLSHLAYQFYYDRSGQPGRKVCVNRDVTNVIADKVCMLETGKQEPDYEFEEYRSYGYLN